jgi:hypothetical protein
VARSASIGRIGWFLLALAAVAGCDGKAIRLGNWWDGSTTCTSAQLNANEVLWIGDSWILVTPTTHTRVRDLARMAGAIGSGDDYVIAAAPATTMAAIANQYTTREAGATKVKVLIMDGGTWDTITANGSGPAAVSSAAMAAATAFGNLLTQVAADGTVEHVIYFLVPELGTIPGVATLRPLVEQACGASTVPCHFIDLQDIWSVHPEYTDPALGFLPTDDGSKAVADAIWAVMQQYCIAQ